MGTVDAALDKYTVLDMLGANVTIEIVLAAEHPTAFVALDHGLRFHGPGCRVHGLQVALEGPFQHLKVA